MGESEFLAQAEATLNAIETELAEADFLHGRYAILRRGKKNMAVVELAK